MNFARRLTLALLGLLVTAGPLAAEPIRIVALGASVTNGKGVDRGAAFPAQIEKLLKDQGYDVAVTNAGIDDDTPAGMLSRLSRDVPEGTRIVVYQPGANDKFSGKEGAAHILAALRERHIITLLYPSSALDQQGRTLAQEYGAIFLGGRLMETMGTRGQGIDKRYLLDGTHFTPEGHKLAAGVMAEEIKRALAARPGPAGSPGRSGGAAAPAPNRPFDADGDGVVTLEEFIAGRRQKLGQLDIDRDGVLSSQEFEGALPPQMPPPLRDRLFSRADGNGDGRITADEFDAGSREIFRALDRSGTGRLSSEEFSAVRPAMLMGAPAGADMQGGGGGAPQGGGPPRRPGRPQP